MRILACLNKGNISLVLRFSSFNEFRPVTEGGGWQSNSKADNTDACVLEYYKSYCPLDDGERQ